MRLAIPPLFNLPQTGVSDSRYEIVCDGCGEKCEGCIVDNGGKAPVCEDLLSHANNLDGTATLETLVLEAGYWRTTKTSRNVLACFNEKACLGGVTGNPGYCSAGYEGPCEWRRISITSHPPIDNVCPSEVSDDRDVPAISEGGSVTGLLTKYDGDEYRMNCMFYWDPVITDLSSASSKDVKHSRLLWFCLIDTYFFIPPDTFHITHAHYIPIVGAEKERRIKLVHGDT